MKRQDRKRQVWKYQKPLNIYKILHLMKCRFKFSLRYYFSQKKKKKSDNILLARLKNESAHWHHLCGGQIGLSYQYYTCM